LNSKKPKWKLQKAISKAHSAINLVKKYQGKIIDRLTPGEFDRLLVNLTLLEKKGSGQTETLIVQKTETQSVGSKSNEAYESVSAIRKLVTKTTSDKEIRTAFGIGTKVSSNSISELKASINIIAEGYRKFTEWANSSGIIESDISALQAFIPLLTTAINTREEAKTGRTTTTIDKDVIQRSVEDIVTKISGIGVLVFHQSNPELVALFEALIPGSDSSDDDDDDTKGKKAKEDSSKELTTA
jgi:hypothetical protein